MLDLQEFIQKGICTEFITATQSLDEASKLHTAIGHTFVGKFCFQFGGQGWDEQMWELDLQNFSHRVKI